MTFWGSQVSGSLRIAFELCPLLVVITTFMLRYASAQLLALESGQSCDNCTESRRGLKCSSRTKMSSSRHMMTIPALYALVLYRIKGLHKLDTRLEVQENSTITTASTSQIVVIV